MTDQTAPVEPLLFERPFTVGSDYPTRFARAFFIYTFTRPRRWIVLVLLLLVFTAAFFLSNRNSTPLLFPLAYVILLVVIYGVGYFATVRQLRRRVPPGPTFSVGFRSTTFVIRSPQVSSEVAYSLYQSCQRWGGFVVLRQRVSRVASFLPAEVFTDESFEFLQSKISRSTPRG